MKAAVITSLNPYQPHRDRKVRVVERRHTLGRLAPKIDRPFVCLRNGQAVLRRDWGQRVADGDVVIFMALPRGGGGGGSNPLKILASIVVAVFAWWAAPYVAGAVFGAEMATATVLGTAITYTQLVQSAIGLIGSVLVSALLPSSAAVGSPSAQMMALPTASPTYALQAQGNAARLENPIPVQYGRVRCFPDFASQPYVEYSGNEQYLYQLFVIGLGEFDVEAIQIEDTPVANWDGVSYEIIPPGSALTLFPSNVVSSDEVAGQDLTTSYSGPFVANAAGTDALYIGIDLICPRGLCTVNQTDGSLVAMSWTARVECREIDDNGDYVGDGSYTILDNPTKRAATTTPQRWSFKYALPGAGRYEVRVKRTDIEQTGSQYAHDLVWGGMRAYLRDTRDYGNVTMLALRMQATNQLSSSAARKINVISTRKLQSWTPGGGWDATPVATTCIGKALMDAATASYGARLDDSRVDLLGIFQMCDTWAARGDEFNGRFDTATTAWEALSTIAKAGRAKPYMQGGILRVFRDQAETVPVALYSMRNIVRNSFGIDYLTPTEAMADCVDVVYWDRDYWITRRVRCALSGSDELNPAEITLFGITDRDHAHREGLYYAACNLYRRKMVRFSTEMEGFLPALGDLIAIQHDMPAWGQHAEIIGVSQNLALRSQELDNAAWTKTSLTTAGMANVIAAPDGTTTAEQLVAAGANATCLQAVTAASATYTFSIWLKRKTGTGSVQLTADGSTWATVAVGATWERFEVSATTANPSGGVRLVTSGDAVYAWGGQLEAAAAAGPYGPTTSAAITVLALTEVLTWQPGESHYIGLRSSIGGVNGPYAATACPMDADAVATTETLAEAPYTGGAAERTHLVFGWAETWRQLARVLAVRPRSLSEVEIECVNEDASVHTADQGITAPAVQTSQLPTQYTAPQVAGFAAYSDPTDVDLMLLSWQPAVGADHYLLEVSHVDDQEEWTRIGDTSAANFTARAIYGSATILRIAAIGLTRGPWVRVAYAQNADYMWNAIDTTLMWAVDDSTAMWAY